MKTNRTIGALAAPWVGILSWSAAEHTVLGNFVSYQCGVGAPVVVLDQSPDDDDAAEDSIMHSFDCDVDAGVGTWHAEGTLIGIFGPPDTATTKIAQMTIENTGGNVQAQVFKFDHVFQTPLGPPPPLHTAVIAGHFDSFASATVQGAKLNYEMYVDSVDATFETILNSRFPADGSIITGPAPIPFAEEGGPVTIDAAIRHRTMMTFYLDSPGDAIVFGEDEGLDVDANPIPEPGTGLLLLAAVVIGRRRG